jgi:predicted AAA+ superfamily ATPase
MFIERKIGKNILNYMQFFPAVCVTGPRQSGKTTLIRKLFPHLPYFSFEDPDTRLTFNSDPKGFLKNLPDGAVIDEAQQVPDLFSYIQGVIDNPGFKGKYILSGSQNFLLLNRITQTLAGRTGIVKLFPFSLSELIIDQSLLLHDCMLKGFYPRVFHDNIPPEYFYPNYIQTYIERDIANIKNITDKTTFFRFLKLCAARCGQILNYSQLAAACGVAVNTVKAWISLLESSYIIFLLPPWYVNISKQLVKSPKLYFYDTGLASWLLDIKSTDQLTTHYLYGALFENLVMADIMKNVSFSTANYSCFFLRDKTGHEIDLVLKHHQTTYAEIKAGGTFHSEYVKNLHYFNDLIKADNLCMIFSGAHNTTINNVKLLNWSKVESLFD